MWVPLRFDSRVVSVVASTIVTRCVFVSSRFYDTDLQPHFYYLKGPALAMPTNWINVEKKDESQKK
jgi:hypothetical protein